jgi:hypothetical protein
MERTGLVLTPLDATLVSRSRRGQQHRHHTVVTRNIAHLAAVAIDDHLDSLIRMRRTLETGSDKNCDYGHHMGPTFRITAQPDGSWLAQPVGAIEHLSHGRLVRGWNDVNTLRREWRAQAHWSPEDHERFLTEFGDPRVVNEH